MKNKIKLFYQKQNTGFTLIELIVVIAIVGILVAVIIPSVTSYIGKSKESVLISNMSGFARMVSIYSIDYNKSNWYDTWSNDGDGSLNNFIELELETINAGTYENNINLINPYSGKKSILDYNNTLSSGDGYCPAVFLTANNAYSYTGTGSTKNIIGSIVAYFKVSGGVTEYIQIYFVKKDGTKSDKLITQN